MATVQLPRFMKESRGRADCWRWEIGGRDRPKLVAAGFKSQDLKDDAGAWLDFTAAKKLADQLNTRVDRWKAGGADADPGIAPPPLATGARLTVSGMAAAWRASEGYRAKAIDTQRQRKSCLVALEAAFGDVAPASVTRERAFDLYGRLLDFAQWRTLQGRAAGTSGAHLKFAGFLDLPKAEKDAVREKRFEAMEDADGQPDGAPWAYHVCSIARQLWAWSADSLDGFAAPNPFLRMRLATPGGRVRRITDAEFAILDQAAIDMNMPELGDAFFLGIQTCQRRADLAKLGWQVRETGRIDISQQKTKVRVDFRAPTALTARLETIWQRHRTAGFARMDRILLDVRGRAYDNPEDLTRYLPALRARAIALQVKAGQPVTLDDVVLHDSRDTGVIIRFEAGMDAARVAEHSGHSLRQLDLIKKSYLGRNQILADQATDMLDAFNAKQAGRG